MSIKQTETGKMIGRGGERNLKDTQNIKHKKRREERIGCEFKERQNKIQRDKSRYDKENNTKQEEMKKQ